MAIRPQGRKRTLSKKVSSFNMWMDQVYQVRAIMESTGATKDAPVIRVLLDEALGARRRKALGISDSEELDQLGKAEDEPDAAAVSNPIQILDIGRAVVSVVAGEHDVPAR